MNEKVFALAKQFEEQIIAWRRQFHRWPEPGGREEKTAEFVAEQALRLGLTVHRAGEYGVIAVLDTGRPGKSVALRADMDALPVPEHPENLTGKRAVISENPGFSHACGHDAHTAMLLGAMEILCALRAELRGKVLFCFESDEEGGTGWPAMVEKLEELGVDCCFAQHGLSSLESGRINIADGPRMSGMVAVNLEVVGRGGHGSRPDLSVNPVFAAASALNNLAVAAANQIDANEVLTLGITSIQGGLAYNVIPDRAKVLGTMRYFKNEVGEKALTMLKSVFDHTAAMHGCTVAYDPQTRIYVRPTVNDPEVAAMARRALPEDWLTDCDKWYASETFSACLNRWPGAMAFLGIRNEELGCGAEHHNEHFDLDESALWRGTAAYAAFAVEAMK